MTHLNHAMPFKTQTAFRTWKAGKTWLFAGAVTLSLIGGATLSTPTAKAAGLNVALTVSSASSVSATTSGTATLSAPTAPVVKTAAVSIVKAVEATATLSATASSAGTSLGVTRASSSALIQSASSSALSGNSVVAVASLSSVASSGTLQTALSSGLASANALNSVLADSSSTSTASAGQVSSTQKSSLAATTPATTASGILDTTIGDLVQDAISAVGISGLANVLTILGKVVPGLGVAADTLNALNSLVNIVGSIQDAAAAPGQFILNALKAANIDLSSIPLVGTEIVNAVTSIPSMDPAAFLNWMKSPSLSGIGLGWVQDTLTSNPLTGEIYNTVVSTIGSVTNQVVTQLNTAISSTLNGVSFDLGTMLSLHGQSLLDYLTALVVNAAINTAGKAIWMTLSPFLSQIPFIGGAISSVLGPIFNNLSGASLGELASLTGLTGFFNLIQTGLSTIGNFFSGAWSLFQSLLSQAQGAINSILGGLGNVLGIFPGLGTIWNSVTGVINNLINSISKGINSLLPSII